MQTKLIDQDAPPTDLAFLIPCGAGPGRDTPIALEEFSSIGRDLTCRVCINDPCVSGRHARIERRPQGWFLRDQASRNGTFLNGSRITEAALVPNDKVRFGETVFAFSDVAAGAAPLVSKNLEWNAILARLPAFALTEFPVLITGPSGAGKDVLARWIHAASPRAGGPFVSINCSALSENLVESELFGHVKGSFTGAIADRKGAFESARGGVLFLDEIGDLPLTLQPKLLRALENAEIRPVGGDRSIQTHVRIIAATHQNLAARARTGEFREDLYYRLCVCTTRAPALAERMEDFDELLYKFAKELRVRFSFGAIAALKTHSWPGNVRELRNAVTRAAAYFPGRRIEDSDVDSLIERVRLQPEVAYLAMQRSIGGEISTGECTMMANLATMGTGGQRIKELEREMILRRLVANRGNQRRTADELGLPKSTLHDRIKTYGIDLRALGFQ